LVVFSSVLCMFMLAGCQGSGNQTPVNPVIEPTFTSGADEGFSHGGQRNLLGLYKVILDTEKPEVEMVPLRSALFHVNLVEELNALNGVHVGFDFFASDPAHKIWALDFTFDHPYPASQSLYGFDARGILITPGSLNLGGPHVVADVDEWRLLNADGYTRWWNPVEFTGSGLYGYVPGDLGTPDTEYLTATVNPYKYFCSYLDKYQPVVDMVNIPLDDDLGRGITLVGESSTRRYKVKLPTASGAIVVFNYALDANWDYPDPFPPDEVPDDFPMKANQSEAYFVDVKTDVNTLYYNPDSGGGGQLIVSVDVYDWQGRANGDVAIEVSVVRLYAPELVSEGQTLEFVSADGIKATYSIDLSGIAVPSHAGEHLVLVRVGSLDYMHYNMYCPVAPDEPISAYDEIILDVPEQACEADDNNTFDEAEAMDWGDVVQGSLCRIGGDLIDYADYYSFTVGSDPWDNGTLWLYTESADTRVAIFDTEYNKLTEETASGGVASIETVGLCDPGEYFIRILTHNEIEMVQYQVELETVGVPDPPVITDGVSGPIYPRNKHEVTYEVTVDSGYPVDYEWKVEHPEGLYTVNLDDDNGDGSVDIIFDWIGIPEGEWIVTCRVDDGINPPVNAEPLTVFVNGMIYHADMNDTTTGNNEHWFYMNPDTPGETHWTYEAVTDDHLEGTGRKFGPSDTDCEPSSGHVLVSDWAALPEEMTKGIIVVRHSWDFGEVGRGSDNMLWNGYNGGNIKIVQTPELPYHEQAPAEIRNGRPYWSTITDPSVNNLLEGQEVFSGVNTYLTESVMEIPPEYAGSSIYIGFAAATGNYMGAGVRGWLIDDVKIYILDDTPNAGVEVEPIEGGYLTPAFDTEMSLTLPADDPDGDRIFYQWYLWDFRYPGNRIETGYYPNSSSNTIDFTVQSIIEGNLGYLWNNSNRYLIWVKASDGYNIPGFKSEWVVGAGILFRADWESTLTNFDSANWTQGFNSGSPSNWYIGGYENPYLSGKGPMFSGGDYTYDYDSHSVLFTPQFFIPPGFTYLSLRMCHSYEFEYNGSIHQCQDGGNIHILDGETYMDDFTWNVLPANIDDGDSYDCILIGGHELAGMPGFCDEYHPLDMRFSIHTMDPSWVANPGGVVIAFAASTWAQGITKAGWQLDDVTVTGSF